MTKHRITCPLEVWISSKKKFILNLNNYRNANHHILNKAKIEFKALMVAEILMLPKMGRVRIKYTLFPGSKRKIDTANVCAIVDKFLCDAIVTYGKLPDDDYRHVLSVEYVFGGVDKHRPRVEVEISET